MKVIVLGAGIAGITTAWYLASGGAEVTVLDRAEQPAAETSHANGGHLSTQSALPWTGPVGLHDFLLSRFTSERAIRFLPTREQGRMDWFVRALLASRPSAYRHATETLLRLARLSRECLETLIAELNADICMERRGMLSIYRHERAFVRARRHQPEDVQVLSAREALEHEPALADSAVRIAGALYYPADASGDCLRFCVALTQRAKMAGVNFRLGETARNVVTRGGTCRGVDTDQEHINADACVVALGAQSPTFMRKQGLRLPILALRGHTLTAPITPDAAAPGQINDIEQHLVCARLGDRFRVAAMADFTGPNAQPDWGRKAQLERLARQWYPAMPSENVTHWSCLRPITPDGPPILGESGLPGLWLNTGLGPLGWTLGCGAGRIVADLVLGKNPPITLDGLTRARFR